MRLFSQSVPYYDAIYDAVGKNYSSEAKRLRELIRRYKRSDGNLLLDVACGTGRHISYLKSSFRVDGLDLNRNMLALARRRNPDVHFYEGSMLTFKLQKRFDAITCLFSAIGHMTTKARLRKAIKNFSLHLRSGGVLIVEPWVTPRNFRDGTLHVVFADEPKLKVVRVGRSWARGRTSTLDFEYIVATPKAMRHFAESEKFGLFTHAEYMTAFRLAGLKAAYDKRGLIGRGLYIGVKP